MVQRNALYRDGFCMGLSLAFGFTYEFSLLFPENKHVTGFDWAAKCYEGIMSQNHQNDKETMFNFEIFNQLVMSLHRKYFMNLCADEIYLVPIACKDGPKCVEINMQKGTTIDNSQKKDKDNHKKNLLNAIEKFLKDSHSLIVTNNNHALLIQERDNELFIFRPNYKFGNFYQVMTSDEIVKNAMEELFQSEKITIRALELKIVDEQAENQY